MAITLELRKRADKSGPAPKPGEPWPLSHVEVTGDLPAEHKFSTRFVQQAAREGWLRMVNVRRVERPSKPAPVMVDGVVVPSPTHYLAAGAVNDPKPHEFLHCDALELTTSTHGVVRYLVVHQPDKYVEDATPETPMTLEDYAAGKTRVDHFYGVVLEG